MPALVIALTVVLAAAPEPSRAEEPFDAIRRQAQPLESLAAFLERYIGSCRDIYTRADCERNVASARRAFQGKKLVARVGDGAAELVRARSGGGRFRIEFVPFIDGGGLALTHGAPLRQDDRGRPIIGLVVLQGELPPSVGDLEFQSPFRTGNVEMEVVFEVQGTWKMKRRDGGFYEGVKARFLALRLVDPRTGAEIASRVL
ncbi:MAG TPA: DUF6066 family protein [Anaeromyxobacteraceae bacterium]|nr:DUF6066 family protein [Anaeromyxobacteraceae bacterium]